MKTFKLASVTTLLFFSSMAFSQASKVEADKTALLKQLSDSIHTKMDQIEELQNRGSLPQALTVAKSILDESKTKLGIDPKAKIQNPIFIDLQFDPHDVVFGDLNESEKSIVISDLRSYDAGLYLDLINLYKRTKLTYAKLSYTIYQKNGGLDDTDRAKILGDVADAINVPIIIQDRKHTKIFVLDNEVADEDQSYNFNRELRQFVVSAKDLHITKEGFDVYSANALRAITPVHGDGEFLFVVQANVSSGKLSTWNEALYEVMQKVCAKAAPKSASVIVKNATYEPSSEDSTPEWRELIPDTIFTYKAGSYTYHGKMRFNCVDEMTGKKIYSR